MSVHPRAYFRFRSLAPFGSHTGCRCIHICGLPVDCGCALLSIWLLWSTLTPGGGCVCVCVCLSVCLSCVCVCVCVCERERERERESLYVPTCLSVGIDISESRGPIFTVFGTRVRYLEVYIAELNKSVISVAVSTNWFKFTTEIDSYCNYFLLLLNPTS